MSDIKQIKNLNQLPWESIHRRWLWGSESNYALVCDYLQKINYSIQDLNNEIKNVKSDNEEIAKEVIYIVVLVDWIFEAVKSIKKLLKNNLGDRFDFEDDDNVKQAEKYLKALRSFIVAHPLNTDRHEQYGLDGNFICVDIRSPGDSFLSLDQRGEIRFHINLNGMSSGFSNRENSFILYSYSQKIDENESYKVIECNFNDLYYISSLEIENIYKLARYIKDIKKE